MGFNFPDKHQASQFFECVDRVEEKLKEEINNRKSRTNLFEKNSKNRMSVKKYSDDTQLDESKTQQVIQRFFCVCI